MMEGSLDSGRDTRLVKASWRIGTSAMRSKTRRHMESRGWCLAELTAGRSHEVR